jgi:phosphatidylglycerol---prolipoprotein diacylglyceryl transferase
MIPAGFSIGPLYIHFYGILVMLGVLVATFMASWNAKHYKQNGEVAWDLLPWLLIAGVIGARIWHILTPPPSMVERGITAGYYFTHPLDALAIWNGGLGIPGAVIGGLIALWICIRQRKLSLATWTDIIAPGLVLAQAIGRWGNFVNQELYGSPTNLPWAIFIDPAHRLPGYENITRYHPLFLYESLLNLANMAVLLWVGRRFKDRLKPGDVFLVYLIFYPVVRFSLEFLRMDASQVGGINFNQTLMAVIAILATAALILRHRRGPKGQTGSVTPANPVLVESVDPEPQSQPGPQVGSPEVRQV